MSTQPGVTSSPSASSVRPAPAVSTSLPTAVMRPPSTPTSPVNFSAPVPSTIVPPRMTSSCAMRTVFLSLAECACFAELLDAGVVVAEDVAEDGLGVLADGRCLLHRRQLGVEVLERRRQLLGAEPVAGQPRQPVLELRVVDDRLG